MFNRFFKKNDDSKASSAETKDSGASKAEHEMPAGGGFFNLPPVVKQPPAAPNYPSSHDAQAQNQGIGHAVQQNISSHAIPQKNDNSIFGGMEVKPSASNHSAQSKNDTVSLFR